ncbi:MAG: hypothetical protein QXG91_00185 [Candidatus Aenigmatarchaeota archaeon]
MKVNRRDFLKIGVSSLTSLYLGYLLGNEIDEIIKEIGYRDDFDIFLNLECYFNREDSWKNFRSLPSFVSRITAEDSILKSYNWAKITKYSFANILCFAPYFGDIYKYLDNEKDAFVERLSRDLKALDLKLCNRIIFSSEYGEGEIGKIINQSIEAQETNKNVWIQLDSIDSSPNLSYNEVVNLINRVKLYDIRLGASIGVNYEKGGYPDISYNSKLLKNELNLIKTLERMNKIFSHLDFLVLADFSLPLDAIEKRLSLVRKMFPDKRLILWFSIGEMRNPFLKDYSYLENLRKTISDLESIMRIAFYNADGLNIIDNNLKDISKYSVFGTFSEKSAKMRGKYAEYLKWISDQQSIGYGPL